MILGRAVARKNRVVRSAGEYSRRADADTVDIPVTDALSLVVFGPAERGKRGQ
jgi:hypothetical protein